MTKRLPGAWERGQEQVAHKTTKLKPEASPAEQEILGRVVAMTLPRGRSSSTQLWSVLGNKGTSMDTQRLSKLTKASAAEQEAPWTELCIAIMPG